MGNSKSNQIPPSILNDRSEEIIVSLRNGTPLTPTVTISCAVGDITSFSALNGAVVNAANGNLIYGLGIAQALRRAGGPILDTESAALMAEYAKHNKKPLPAGGATVTGAGNMANYKKIIQAIGPVVGGKKPTPEERFRLMQAYEQIFRVAELYGCDKLIIPFLSTGQFGFDTKMGMQTALYAVLNKLPAHGIREVVFVCNDKGKIETFKKMAKGTLPLHLQSRKHATHLLVNHCADIRFDILPSIKARVMKEINDLFDVTRIVLGVPAPVPAPSAAPVTLNIPPSSQNSVPTAAQATMLFPAPVAVSPPPSNHTPHAAKRRITPHPPGAVKRVPLASSPPAETAVQSTSQASEGFAAERAAEAERKRAARARESQEQTVARNAKKNEQQRMTRGSLSQNDQEEMRMRDRQAHAERRASMTAEQQMSNKENDRKRKSDQRAAQKARSQADAERRARARETEQERTVAVTQIEESQEERDLRISQAAERRAERTTRREVDKNKTKETRNEEEENAFPTIDVLNPPKKSKRNEDDQERRARLERDKKYQGMDISHSDRPLRKEGSRIIIEQHKDYNNWVTGKFGLGPMPVCVYCKAFTYTGRCCSGGRVHVPLPAEPPFFYSQLLTGNSNNAKHFRQHILHYNRAFAMGSMSCERELFKNCAPFIKLNGMPHYQIGGLRAPADKQPLFGQIYLFDPEEAARHRINNPVAGDLLRQSIVMQFSDFLHDNNSLARQFQRISKIVEETEASGQRVGNGVFVVKAPQMSDIVGGRQLGTLTRPVNEPLAVMYKTDDRGAPPPKGIWVRPYQGGHMTELAYYDPTTEPMVYPLHYLYGETGYKYGDDKLFPSGTTREQAGFSEKDDNRNEFDTPPQSQREATPMPMEVDSDVSEDNEDDTRYETTQRMAPRTEEPVDFAAYSDPEDEEYAMEDDDGADEGEEEEEDEETAIDDDGADQMMIEEPDDEIDFVQMDVGQENEARRMTDVERRRLHPSRRQHAVYRLRERVKTFEDVEDKKLNVLGAASGKLSQTAIIDTFLKILKSRADFNRTHFAEFRGSTKKDLTYAYDVLQKKASKLGLNVGYSFRLPRTFPTSNAWYNELFDKSMVLLIKVGGPDLFITFTGNNKWEEIAINLVPPEMDWQSNPLTVCEVFYKKQQELMEDVVNQELFGPVIGYVYSIEFQKRGMPHMHLLVIMKRGHKFDKEALIEKHVWARFPEIDSRDVAVKEIQTRSRKNVAQFNVHAPCKGDNGAYCQIHPARNPNKIYPQCTKRFPKEISDFTKIMPDGTVVYLRPRIAIGVLTKDSQRQQCEAFNEWVVTYNPHLTSKFESHINVEVVSSTHVFKYLFKYIFKGYDRAIMELYPRLDNPANDGNDGTTVTSDGALLPNAAAKMTRQAKKAAKKMQSNAKRMGVETKETGTTVNFDEAIIRETFRETTSCEAAWGILGFPLAGQSHDVKLLNVHEPDEQPILFRRNEVTGAIEQALTGNTDSQLIAYMKLNQHRERSRTYRRRNANSPPPPQSSAPDFTTASDLPATTTAAATQPPRVRTPSPIPSTQCTQSWNEENESDWGEDDYDQEIDGEEDQNDNLHRFGIDTSRGPTFEQIARTHKFDKKTRKWKKYQRKPSRLLTMIRAVNVRKTELFAIRLLVTNVGGICSFDDMLTYRGIKYDTFTDAAYARGLMNSQKEYLDLLKDALTRETPCVVRRMFADCIIYAGLLRPSEIWAILRWEMIDEKYKKTKASKLRGLTAALYHINVLLKRANLTADEFNLRIPQRMRLTPYEMVEAVNDMPSVNFSTPDSLTDEQQNVFDSVVECVESGKSQCFFLQASGGCGKTFLKIDTELRRRWKRVTNVASTGIASTLLRSGSTAHRQFFIPLNVDENKLSTMKMESLAARWLRGTDLIIFDEATMADKWIFNCVDVLLQNIMDNQIPFGGKVVLLGGDWKQLLPVVTARSAEVAEDFTILSSPLWKHFKVLTLSKNIRAKNDPEFAAFLEETGEGRFNGKLSSFVQIDKPEVMMPSQASVLQSIYEGKLSDEEYLFKSCVLCTTNKQAEEVNKIVLSKVPGMERVYRAIDTPAEGLGRQIPPEAFHTNMESGMPPHVLVLKKGAIIILLRNININAGLCNGTRLVITNMYDKYIEAKHLDPRWNGRVHQIERMHLTPPETATQKPPYSRFQFPLRLAYCLTINKSQGQTFERVGILLQRNVFAHGQLYVALSRVHSFKDLKIFSRATKEGVEGIVLANTVSAYTIDRMKQAIAASRPIPDVSSQPATLSPPIRRPVIPPRLPTPPSPPAPITGPRDDFADIIMNQSTTARRPTTLSRPSVAPFIPLIRPSTRPLPPPRSPSIRPLTPSPRSSSIHPTTPSPARHQSLIPPTQWLRLTNRGTDCFLNASLQCLRRIPEFIQSLANRDLEENVLTEALLTELERILTTNGMCSARNLREMLPNALPRLEADFLNTQQDATEIIIKLFSSLIPANITNQFKIKEHRWRRCRDTYNTTCTKRAIQPTSSVPSLIHVGEMNQVVDLEKRFSNVYYVTDVDDDGTGHHCESCCECCISHQGEDPVHVREGCADCAYYNTEYYTAEKYTVHEDTKHVLIVFSILQEDDRYDWALSSNCNLQNMQLMGKRWKAVSMIQHHGNASGGHYTCWTREDDEKWWHHDDAADPRTIGREFRQQTEYHYRNDAIDMKGIAAILFEKL